jgi:hypothetical protein
MADGITNTQRVDGTTERKLYAKVVDQVMNSRTYFSRMMGKAKSFQGKSMDFTVKIASASDFEWFAGLETLNSAANDNTVTLSYRHVAGTKPQVSIMLESFANAGDTGTIPLDRYKFEEAASEMVQEVGSAIYGTGAGDQPLGLEAIVDDGTNVATIGGQSRTTYASLKADVDASGGTLTLAKLATLHDGVSAAGISESEPNIHLTTKAVWSLYEQLIHPQLRNNYNILPVRSDESMKRGDAQGRAGFTALEYRGKPVIKDDAATSGVWYMLNEKTFGWYGRTIVPEEYAGKIKKVDLGTARAMEGTGIDTLPSEYNGIFYQPLMLMPNQAGMVGRFYIIGQMCAKEFRRNGKLTGITGV